MEANHRKIARTPDASKPSPRRQAELREYMSEREKLNLPPLAELHLGSLGELLWVLLERKWIGGLVPGIRHLDEAARWFMSAQKQLLATGPLQQADLRNLDVNALDLRWADLRSARLDGADLRRSNLEYGCLTDATLSGTLLSGSRLGHGESATRLIDSSRETELSKVRNSNSMGPPYQGVHIRTRNELLWIMRTENWSGEHDEATKSRADLRGTNLSELDLNGANLTGADLTGSTLIREESEKALLGALSGFSGAEKAPCKDVRIQSRNELQWVMRRFDWSGDPDATTKRRADLRGAVLSQGQLRCADLEEANLCEARLDGADLRGANLRNADLRRAVATRCSLKDSILSSSKAHRVRLDLADLRHAELLNIDLRGATLANADLSHTNLSVAILYHVDCREADFRGADLRGSRVDAATSFIDVRIDKATLLGDIIWIGLPLTQVDWSQAPTLGDELLLQREHANKSRDILFRDTARAYRNLWTALRRQGLYRAASRYRLREKRIERQAMREEHNYLGWLSSLWTDIVSGYGEIPGRVLWVFVSAILGYTAAYYFVSNTKMSWVPGSGKDKLDIPHSLALSVTLFEGHSRSLTTVVSALGVTETIIGAYILLAFSVLRSRQILGHNV